MTRTIAAIPTIPMIIELVSTAFLLQVYLNVRAERTNQTMVTTRNSMGVPGSQPGVRELIQKRMLNRMVIAGRNIMPQDRCRGCGYWASSASASILSVNGGSFFAMSLNSFSSPEPFRASIERPLVRATATHQPGTIQTQRGYRAIPSWQGQRQ